MNHVFGQSLKPKVLSLFREGNTEWRLNLVDRREREEKGDKGDRGEKVLTFHFPFSIFHFLIGVTIAGSMASLVICGPLTLVQAQTIAQNITSAIRQGFTLLKQGRVEEAIKLFEQAVRGNSQSVEAKLGLAIAYRRQGLIEAAWDTYQQVLTQDSTNELALKSLGFLASYKPEWQLQGIEALTTLLNLNPNDTEALGWRGLLYNYQGKFAEALADYQIVLQANPTPEVLLGAAEAYTYSGNPQQGLELFKRYQATGEKMTGYATLAYARALRETGDSSQAVTILEAQLKQSTSLDELAIQTRAALSQAYLASGLANQAFAVLEPLQGRTDAVLPLARSLNEIRNQTKNEALASSVASLYRQALTENPNPEPKLWQEVADVFSGLPSERQTALQLYRQLTASQPNDRTLLVKRLALESQLGLISELQLRQSLAAALQTLPTNPSEQQQLATALVRIEPPGSELLPVYLSLLQSGVNAPFLNFRVAQMYIEANDLPQARNALAVYTATTQGAQDLAPQLLAAEIERREGSLEAAARRYQGLLASNSADQDILNAALRGLSGIRLAQNRPQEALAIYDQLIARNPQDTRLQLARASLAYETELISESEAEAVLSYWLQTQPATNLPPELFSLAAALPADGRREPLYNSLLQIDPSNMPLQIRLIQAIAQRSPAQARARVTQLVARDPSNITNYLLQGQLAQAIDELDLASRAYEVILSAQPNNREALAALGGIRFQQRRFDSASELYSQALAIKPDDLALRQSLIDLNRAQDLPLKALAQLEQLQLEQMAQGNPESNLTRQRQEIQEDFLRRRGFQPTWERF
ncbi:tetratricopeptide repeat protein [Lyngbya aestuarii]|uniref:tetratricopeptide repeat protein n=1 Tax=Lyngbya aestuarii TaxID=118322 RepID=UPI00403D891E